MKVIATCPIYNEISNGNLERYLKNVSKLCDDIIILDDCSTDNPDELIYQYTNNLYATRENNRSKKLHTLNRGFLLSKAREMNGDWLLMLDADEIMEKKFTREIMETEIEKAEKNNIVSLRFIWVNLWMSTYYYRTDKGLGRISPPRLYKILDEDIEVIPAMHQRDYPPYATDATMLDYHLLHYSSSHIERLINKIVNYIILDTRNDFETTKYNYLYQLFNGVVTEEVNLDWFDNDNIPNKEIVDFAKLHKEIQNKAELLLAERLGE